MEETLFQLPGTVSKVHSMHGRSVRVQIDSQENLTDAQMSKLMSTLEKIGWFTFSVERPITPEAIASLPKLEWNDGQKSPAQRLRGVIFIRWEQAGKPMDSFEMYYASIMERLIDQFKEKLT